MLRILLLILAFSPVGMALAEEAKSVRVSVPSASEQEIATQKIKSLYAADYAKIGQQDVAALAKKLLAAARNFTGDSGSQYVMVMEAIDAAGRSGDVGTVSAGAELLAQKFEVDARNIRDKALVQAGRSVKSKEAAAIYLMTAMPAIEERAAAGEFEEANALIKMTQSIARMAGAAVGGEATDRLDIIVRQQTEYPRIKPMIAKLATDPTNTQANGAVGRYQAIFREDWPQALPLLVRGDDPGLRAAAEAELALGAPTDKTSPLVAMKVGDAWLTAASKLALPQRPSVCRRALFWFQNAEPKLKDLEHATVVKRIEEARQGIVGPGKPTFFLDLTREEAAAVQKFRDRYYLFVQIKSNYREASEWAKKKGGHLVCIADKSECDFVTAMTRGPREGIWLGCSDEGKEGVWSWVDGTPFKFNNWGKGQPDNYGSGEDFAIIAHDGKWNDAPANWHVMFVVQW